ncbi:MAG: hypothetical protein NTU41_08575 [Chloroflexi bacterium]|nr:hypothetical protein [Chloroflexota bacterium]
MKPIVVGDIFEKATNAFGGRLDVSLFSPSSAKILATAISLEGFPLSRTTPVTEVSEVATRWDRVYLDYVNNWNLNAVAIYEPPIYVCGIWIGLSITVLNLFHLLLLHPHIFSDVGEANRESSDYRPNYSDLLNVRYQLPKDADGRKEMIVFNKLSRDPERRLLANFLGLFANEFVVAHEVSHVYRGHVDYFRNMTGDLPLHEFGSTMLNGIPVEVRQALELDADIVAVMWTAARRKFLATHQIELPTMLNDKRGIVRALTFAYGSLFHLLAKYGKVPNSPGYQEHPSVRIRVRNAVTTLSVILKDADSWDTGIVDAGTQDGIEELRKVSNILGGEMNPLMTDLDSGEFKIEFDWYHKIMATRDSMIARKEIGE